MESASFGGLGIVRVADRGQDILDVAVGELRSGRDIRIEDIAQQVGITKGLIYRYFTNKDELLARAYEVIIRDSLHCNEVDGSTHPNGKHIHEVLTNFWLRVFENSDSLDNWSRLEAFAHYRLTPSLAARIDDLRPQAIEYYTDILYRLLGDSVTNSARKGVLLVLAGAAVGFTAVGGGALSRKEHQHAAEFMADSLLLYLSKNGANMSPN